MPKLESIIESLLFAHGEPLTLKAIAKIIETSEDDIKKALGELAADCRKEDSGMALLEKDGEYQLGSKPEHAPYIEKLVKSGLSEELSKAAVETVAIVAYKGPLSRAEIEHIRGVNSSFTLRNLLMRGLIERIDSPKDARSHWYRVSFDFLKHLGLAKIDDLPQYLELRKEETAIPAEEHNIPPFFKRAG